MDALDQATTEQLIEQLKQRCGALLIASIKPLDGLVDEKASRVTLFWSGGIITCLGLAEYAKSEIKCAALCGDDEDADD
jgi:hypothetical protein